ncbi:DUF72 domain-containing protein [Methylotetracoccus oryzae]|uniref:DUF72 domain-containing protein n=1 Tax=Methylotetracoccus oryzae TaxID=1919059 RepID=UPI0011199F67|nr:DUF72 domain-containing protein [Methylotetracoccus oryzae]
MADRILIGTASWTDKTLIDYGLFNYRYAERKLRELADSIRELSHQTGQVHVLFNNNFGDQAQRNAMELQGRLKA